MKRLLCLLTVLLLAASSACAEIATREEFYEKFSITFTITAFSGGDVPKAVQDVLAASDRWAGATVLSGVMLSQSEAARIVLAAEADGERRLLCFHKTGSDPWVAQSLGTKLLGEDAPTFDYDMTNLGPELSVTCEADGEPVRFELYESSSAAVRLFRVDRCLTQQADGSAWEIVFETSPTTALENGLDGPLFGYCATHYAADGAIICRKRIRWLTASCTDELDLTGFPRTADDLAVAAALAEEALSGDDLCVFGGCNLRVEPTTKSTSLGMYNKCILGRVLGTAEGKTNPWYQVRVGNVTGWVDSAYLHLKDDALFAETLSEGLAPVGRAVRDTPLYDAVGGDTDTLVRAGTEFHVLTEYGEYLHVMIPRGEIGALMDVDGQSGYVLKADVTQAATLALLRGE